MNYNIPNNILNLPITELDLRQVPKPVIVNTVTTYDLWNANIDAETLTMRLPGFSFNPQKFAAIKMRTDRAITLAFCGGRAVCPGSRRVMAARIAALRITGLLVDSGEIVCYRKFRVQNIVCTCWAPFEIELVDIIEEYSGNAEYKDDKFPGLTFRLNEPKIVFNVFVTGKIVITGSRDYEHSIRAWWWLYTHVLVRYRRGTAAGSTSSAAYKVHTQRSRNTLLVDCERLATKYARRSDGPLSQSKYGDLMRTPRSVMSTMSTPITTPFAGPTPSIVNDGQEHTNGVIVLFRRMENVFVAHTIHCTFVRGSADGAAATTDEGAIPYWREALRHLECAIAEVDEADNNSETVLTNHLDAGCIGIGVLRDSNRMTMTIRTYIAQLTLAIDDNIEPEDDATPETEAPPMLQQTGPVSAIQPFEVEDIMDIEAQHRLDAYRELTAETPLPGQAPIEFYVPE